MWHINRWTQSIVVKSQPKRVHHFYEKLLCFTIKHVCLNMEQLCCIWTFHLHTKDENNLKKRIFQHEGESRYFQKTLAYRTGVDDLNQFFSTSVAFKAYQNGTTRHEKRSFCGRMPYYAVIRHFCPLVFQSTLLRVNLWIQNAIQSDWSIHEWKRFNLNQAKVLANSCWCDKQLLRKCLRVQRIGNVSLQLLNNKPIIVHKTGRHASCTHTYLM